MKMLILNGNPVPSGFDAQVGDFAKSHAEPGSETRIVALRDMAAKSCTGCWTCWWGTPGRCIHSDGLTELYADIVASDILVWATPLVMGNVSALTREAQDRMIPLVHPYIELVNGECHHRRRYERMPDIGLLYAPGEGDTERDIEIVRKQHERLALNFRAALRFHSDIADSRKEALSATLAS